MYIVYNTVTLNNENERNNTETPNIFIMNKTKYVRRPNRLIRFSSAEMMTVPKPEPDNRIPLQSIFMVLIKSFLILLSRCEVETVKQTNEHFRNIRCGTVYECTCALCICIYASSLFVFIALIDLLG